MHVTLETAFYYGNEQEKQGDYKSAILIYEHAYNLFKEREVSEDTPLEEKELTQSKKEVLKNLLVRLSNCYEHLGDKLRGNHYLKYAYYLGPNNYAVAFHLLKNYLTDGNIKKIVHLYANLTKATPEESAKLLMSAELPRNSYRYKSTLLKMLKTMYNFPIDDEDKLLFRNKIEEVESNMTPPEITVCMITKNNQNTIAESLESVSKIAKEIVILDLGSKDRTLSIANFYNAKIIKYELEDSFSKAKNMCIKAATKEWVLLLEPNEVLTKETQNELLSYIADQEESEKYSLYMFKYKSEEKPNQLVFYYKPALFRNNINISFKRPVHEELFHAEKQLVKTYCQSLEINAKNKQKSLEDLNEETDIYRNILIKTISENPDPLDNYYYCHFYAIDASIAGDSKKSLEFHYKSLELYKKKYGDKKDSFYLYILMSVVKFLIEKTENNQAIKAFVDKVLSTRPDYPDAIYFQGLYYERISNINKAVELYQKAFELLEDNWTQFRNADLPSVGSNLLYELSEKFESFVW